jgi:UDP-N-acetylmuramyl pentapeptide phosphotransferase/UDP-N-acetylglucosamine-1-phosphate transferase
MDFVYLVVIAFSAFVFSAAGTAVLWQYLGQAQVLDVPNERSNHAAPVPRGAGIAVVFAALSFMLVSGAPHLLLWGALGVAIISWQDDTQGVPIHYRAVIQLAAILLALPALGNGLVFQGLLPLWADRLMVIALWFGFLNLYNFMDGIDGITGAQTMSLGIGMAAMVTLVPALNVGIASDGLVLAAAAFGFLLFNWHPAKIFLGDVGSITLGYLLAFLLLLLAADGGWAAALLLPAYYLTDGVMTFIKRAMRGEKVWQAHSQHGYQQAVRAGWPHDEVVKWITALNLALIGLAAIAVSWPYATVACLALGFGGAVALRHCFCNYLPRSVKTDSHALAA